MRPIIVKAIQIENFSNQIWHDNPSRDRRVCRRRPYNYPNYRKRQFSPVLHILLWHRLRQIYHLWHQWQPITAVVKVRGLEGSVPRSGLFPLLCSEPYLLNTGTTCRARSHTANYHCNRCITGCEGFYWGRKIDHPPHELLIALLGVWGCCCFDVIDDTRSFNRVTLTDLGIAWVLAVVRVTCVGSRVCCRIVVSRIEVEHGVRVHLTTE